MKTRSASALLLAVVVAGCELSTEPSLGDFTGSVTGGHTATLVGRSLFASSHDGQFVITMNDPNGSQAIAVGRFTGRPGVGTYQIELNDPDVDVTLGFIGVYAQDGEPSIVLRSTSGQIQITASSSSRIQGSLTFEAVGFFEVDPETEVTATVMAEFDATCIRTGGSDCA
jgi:hypothetical protein